MESHQKQARKGLRTAYISTIVGIVLVLTVLGISSWVILGVNHLNQQKKEELEIDLFFKKSVNEVQLKLIETELMEKPYVAKAFYRSADEAWEITKEIVGDTALAIIGGENPIDQSVIINLKNDYVNIDSMQQIEKELLQQYEGIINEVSYREEAFKQVNIGMKKVVYFILFFGLLLLIVAIGMINNTIRLALYSKRFTIKTMQLVGATPRFIRRPFLWQAVGQGLLAGIISGAMVFGFILLIEQFMPSVIFMTDIKLFLIVLAGIILFGILITVISTSLALRKYLRLKLDKLYG
ncbi:MAG TPA: FtsX-like permease family protein [Crocinitomix sp.]|nr:FtsX-like permease family protein [Crocinitomix sp.]